MLLIFSILQITLDYFQACLTNNNLQIVLLVGSGILAVGLLMLALTRWGHSRPVWKCVILSVIAHVLLIAYAWGTHLIAPVVVETVVESEPMRINFKEESGDESIEVNPDTLAEMGADWNQFSAHSPSPDRAHLPRPEIDSEIIITRSDSQQQLFQLAPDNSHVERPEVVAPAMVGKFESSVVLAEELAASVASDVKPVQRVRSPNLQPQSIKIARRGSLATANEPQFNPLPFTAESNSIDRADIVADDSNVFQMQQRSQGGFEKPPIGDFRAPRLPDSLADKLDDSRALARKFRTEDTIDSTLRNVSADYVTPRRLADGQPLPIIYSLRNAPNRIEVAKQRGGSKKTEEAVEMALVWLAENQSKDGRWNPRLLEGGRDDKIYGHDREGAGTDADTGITALAVLAFLANGYSHLEGPYQGVVKNGLEYLVSNQAGDGNIAGRAKLFARMYCHSMALLAISEAYAMTGDRRLAVPVQRGVNYSVNAQDPKGGGWRYQPGDDGDMSQFGWQVLALHSAGLAGIDIPRSTKDKMETFLDRCCISPSKGIAAYRPNHGPNTTMTAEALVCRHLLKQPIGVNLQKEATDRIMEQPPSNKRVNMYYWYYGTMAMYLSGGAPWQRWNQQMKATLLDSQVTQGHDRGSWRPDGLWAGYGGRAYSTALAALTLEVYYRYLPIYDVADRSGTRSLR